jgi:hypothetical protein
VIPADFSAAALRATEPGAAGVDRGQDLLPARVTAGLATVAGFLDSRLAIPTGIADAELVNATAATTASIGRQRANRLLTPFVEFIEFPLSVGGANLARVPVDNGQPPTGSSAEGPDAG